MEAVFQLGDPVQPSRRLQLPSAEQLFSALVVRVREGGGQINPKIQRGSLPPLYVPGIVAAEPICESEEILRIPPSLQLTMSLVLKLGTDLILAAKALSTDDVRIECPEVVTFVARYLHTLEARGPYLQEGPNGWSDASWLDLLLGMQLTNSFSYMPHRKLIEDEKARESLLPSPEVHNAVWNESAYHDAHRAISEGIAPEVLGPKFEKERLIQSHLMLLTRTFGRVATEGGSSEHCCVPIADMFNHANPPSAVWDFDSTGDFLIKASRDIQAKEEIFISYGRRKSNVRLFRTYGFTVAPECEPSWSFRVWPTLTTEVYARYLPDADRMKVLDLEATRIDSTTKSALKACVRGGADPCAFIRAICDFFRERYEADSTLKLALDALQRVRSDDVVSSAWWKYGEEKLVRISTNDAKGETASASDSSSLPFTLSALRVKMSEYLCLLVHIEALDLLAGTVREGQCLEQAVELSILLKKALSELELPRNAEELYFSTTIARQLRKK